MSADKPASAESILRKFRSLECRGCEEHFGYQSRADKNEIYCSLRCLEEGSAGGGCAAATPNSNVACASGLSSVAGPMEEGSCFGRLKMDTIDGARVRCKKAEVEAELIIPPVLNNPMALPEPTTVTRFKRPIRPLPLATSKNNDNSELPKIIGTAAASNTNDNSGPPKIIDTNTTANPTVPKIGYSPSSGLKVPNPFAEARAAAAAAVHEVDNSVTVSYRVSKQPKPTMVPDEVKKDAVQNDVPKVIQPVRKIPMLDQLKLSTNILEDDVGIVFSWDLKRHLIGAFADDGPREEMQAGLNKRKFEPYKGTPVVGELVIAYYDGAYYRGVVSKLHGLDVTIDFVDYGDSVQNKITELKFPDEILLKVPIFGLIVDLHLNNPVVKAPPEYEKAIAMRMRVEILGSHQDRPYEKVVKLNLKGYNSSVNDYLEALAPPPAN